MPSDARFIAPDSKTLIQLLLNSHHSVCRERSYRIKGPTPLPEDVTGLFFLERMAFLFLVEVLGKVSSIKRIMIKKR